MQMPAVKTLIKYRKKNGEGKNVVCEFVSEDKYYAVENLILDNYPFSTNFRIECHENHEHDFYELTEYDRDFNVIEEMLVYFGYILTLSDKAFVLKEYKDDYVRFEDIDVF